MLDGGKRREGILKLLGETKQPISGSQMAKKFEVSRQVIVQDIALLRATDKNIISTTKGYLLYKEEAGQYKRVFGVVHSGEEIGDELNTFVDLGGKVLDVVVEHDVYGSIAVDLFVNNRPDVQDFIKKCEESKAAPLSLLTNGKHYHTVTADCEERLDAIEKALKEKGYLISE